MSVVSARGRWTVAAAALALGGSGIVGVRGWQRLHAYGPVSPPAAATPEDRLSRFQRAVLSDLRRQVAAGIRYRDGYYVGGDPPPNVGVCTDVVVRSYRAAGVDIAGDMARDVRDHPAAYRIARPDPNIDHRRCRDLIVFFRRRASTLTTQGAPADWQPGDVVFWSTHRGRQPDHVGVVANGRLPDGWPTIIHHWPALPVAETDGLFRFAVVGHFRWRPASAGRTQHGDG